MDKPDLGNSLISLVECRNLQEAFEIAGTIPEKERIEQTIECPGCSGCQLFSEFRHCPGT